MTEVTTVDATSKDTFAPTTDRDFCHSVSLQVLLCLKRLHGTPVGPVDLSDLVEGLRDQSLVQRMLELLRQQGFITGPTGRASMTAKGQDSARRASECDSAVARFFDRGRPALLQLDPSAVLNALLQAHFTGWLDLPAPDASS